MVVNELEQGFEVLMSMPVKLSQLNQLAVLLRMPDIIIRPDNPLPGMDGMSSARYIYVPKQVRMSKKAERELEGPRCVPKRHADGTWVRRNKREKKG